MARLDEERLRELLIDLRKRYYADLPPSADKYTIRRVRDKHIATIGNELGAMILHIAQRLPSKYGDEFREECVSQAK